MIKIKTVPQTKATVIHVLFPTLRYYSYSTFKYTSCVYCDCGWLLTLVNLLLFIQSCYLAIVTKYFMILLYLINFSNVFENSGENDKY